MTEGEAIKNLKDILSECTESEEAVCYVTGVDVPALEMAINALEKQIPKKPDCIEDKMWCCPVCDNNLLPKWIKYPTKLMPKTEGLPHCMSCGQAIDWSDEEYGKNES